MAEQDLEGLEYFPPVMESCSLTNVRRAPAVFETVEEVG
jgi:hypothetical protein